MKFNEAVEQLVESKVSEKIPLKKAKEIASALLKKLAPLISKVEVAGSMRRKKNEIGDIDLVVQVKPSESSASLLTFLKTLDKDASGGEKKLKMTFEGRPIEFWLTTPETFSSMMMTATGPVNYNIRYRALAKRAGYMLNQYGLWDSSGKKIASTEEEIYKALGQKFKDPELRA